MKKLFTLSLLAFMATLAYAQQPNIAEIEEAKRLKVLDMLQAKSGGPGTNQIMDTIANAPEQDCISAITVCQMVYSQANSYWGGGLIVDPITSQQTCLGAGELNAVWYKVVAAGQGFLGFNLIPNSATDDYDWAVYDLTYNNCSQLGTVPGLEISCDFSGSTFPTTTTGPNGGVNPQDEPLIEVIPGHIYYIVVSNFSNSQSGYTLDFSLSTIPIGNCSFIYGNVYYDDDQNCQRDNNDFALPNQIIYATPGPYYALTDANGFYNLAVP